MKYYLLFGKFEKGEGSFSEQEPQQLDSYTANNIGYRISSILLVLMYSAFHK